MHVRITPTIVATLSLGAGALAQTGGWTVNPAAPGTRVVYVSSSLGNDSNSGLVPNAPVRTIAAGWAKIRDGQPDRLLLKRGDTWDEGLESVDKSGQSPSAMLMIASYGPSYMPRPRLRTPSTGVRAETAGRSVAHVAIMDLDLSPLYYDGNGPDYPLGIDVHGAWHNLLIENCRVQGYATNVGVQGQQDQHASGIRIRRNVIADSYVIGPNPHSQGLIIGHTDGALVEENVLDHNGWREDVPGADTTMFRHNVYINPDNTTEITVRGNIVARGAASGLRCAGTYCDDNLLLANPVSIIGAGFTRRISGNVVIDSRDTGGELQIGKAIVGQFTNCEISGNIIAHRTNPGSWNVTAIDIEDGSSTVRVEGNTVYNWASPDPEWASLSCAIMCKGYSSDILILNNEFQMPRGGRLLWLEHAGYTPGLQFNHWLSSSHDPFATQGTGYVNYWGFVAGAGEQGGAWHKVVYPNPMRTAATFARVRGWGASLDDYMREVRQMERGRRAGPEMFAAAAIRYISQGFGD